MKNQEKNATKRMSQYREMIHSAKTTYRKIGLAALISVAMYVYMLFDTPRTQDVVEFYSLLPGFALSFCALIFLITKKESPSQERITEKHLEIEMSSINMRKLSMLLILLMTSTGMIMMLTDSINSTRVHFVYKSVEWVMLGLITIYALMFVLLKFTAKKKTDTSAA